MKKWRYDSVPDLDQTLGRAFAPFSARAGHARLRIAFDRRLDHPGVAARVSSLRNHRARTPAHQPFVRDGSESFQSSRYTLSSAALPLRKLHRAFPAAAEDYFFRSVSRTLDRGSRGQRVALRATSARSSEPFHLFRTSGESGNVLIIFPEGTRSRTGETREFKPGIGALVAGRDITVLPCYLDGAFHAWPKGRRLPRPGRVRLIVGEPRNYSSRSADKIDISTIASELQRAVTELGKTNGSN